MLADRVSMIIQSLNLRPGMCLCALVDEIENKAPEATLEEIALVLWQVRNSRVPLKAFRGQSSC
jgi:hypothetical protein